MSAGLRASRLGLREHDARGGIFGGLRGPRFGLNCTNCRSEEAFAARAAEVRARAAEVRACGKHAFLRIGGLGVGVWWSGGVGGVGDGGVDGVECVGVGDRVGWGEGWGVVGVWRGGG
ncbi:hypothetical protein T492DRAFT_839692 [Pavlovales sp. CCMP2436]|nr:hypothetical protein T492DRAFT_839692 [Pavlovales sp. CCMP2436]